MKPSQIPGVLTTLLLVLGSAALAQDGSARCDKAWAAYNDFKARNVMDESQYPLTVYGAEVRAACGVDALPAPPGADVAPAPRLRKPLVKPLPTRPQAPPLPGVPTEPLKR